MSTDRKKRLAKLVKLQRQMKAFHETRQAGFIAAAQSAENEAKQLAERFDDPASLSSLFPEIYHNRISSAVRRHEENLASAGRESRKAVAATLRAMKVEEAYRDVARDVDERAADKERLEQAERKANAGK